MKTIQLLTFEYPPPDSRGYFSKAKRIYEKFSNPL